MFCYSLKESTIDILQFTLKPAIQVAVDSLEVNLKEIKILPAESQSRHFEAILTIIIRKCEIGSHLISELLESKPVIQTTWAFETN